MDDRIIPEDFVCPITKDVMEDPVLANDGYTYERIAIMQYVVNEGKSPMTRQEMNEAQLMPNRALKSIIENGEQRIKQMKKLTMNHKKL